MTKKDLIEMFAKPAAGKTDRIPLVAMTEEGNEIELEGFWLQLRFPASVDADRIMTIGLSGDREGSVFPLVKATVDAGVIVDARLPDWNGDEVVAYEWTGNPKKDWKWIASRNFMVLTAIARIIQQVIYGEMVEDVLDEGEEFYTKQDGLMSEETG